MEFREVLATRRSVREYADQPVGREDLEELLRAAVQAPSAMNTQNWAFGVIHSARRVHDFGERARLALLQHLDRQGITGNFRDRAANPEYRPFYNASALVVIYATANDQFAQINCTLAAENLMLAARNLNLGTCWIGSASILFNEPVVKVELKVPDDYIVVAPIIVGHPATPFAEKEKTPPAVLYWVG
jgi:nitroreductase